MKTLAGTIAHRNPEGAAEFVRKYGKDPSSNPAMLEMQIHGIVNKHQNDDVIKDLMFVHPDRDTLLETQQVIHEHPATEKHHNCCGSSHFDGESYSNCSGCNGKCASQPPKQAHFAADGSTASPASNAHMGFNNQNLIIGILGLTALFSLVIIATRK